MFVYMSKRIAIPKGTAITSINWNEEQGWLACGCIDGLLKVLKVDGGAQGQKTGGLSLNQTLEGHDRTVSHVAWNQQYCKLTSSDSGGQIIVWTLHKGMWFEEMVNNRNKSTVVDLAWSVDGMKICIAYEDGAVIVGGVDGNRLWGRELQYELAKVCWSPDDRYILFGTQKGDVFVHEAQGGQYVSQVAVHCVEGADTLAGLAWHPAWVERPEPLATFTICYKSGKMQLMTSIGDEKPLLTDIGIPVQYIAWNPQGTILAVSGLAPTNSPESSVVVTQFFSNECLHLRTLRVSGKRCGGVAWEGDGLRVALAVDSSVYFANVRPQYKYCYFEDTAVFAVSRPDRVEESVMFWNVDSNVRTVKHVRNLIYLSASEDVCVMVSQPEDALHQCMVQLVNAIGSPIETRFVDLEPYVAGMNSSHVVCCGEENIYIWQFRDPNVVVDVLDPVSVQASRRESHQRIIHIDDILRPETDPSMTVRSALTNDLICAVCMSEEYCFVARESGTLHMYRFEPLQLVGKLILPSRPHSMAVNCDSTSLAVVDLGGLMQCFAIEKDKFVLVPRKAVAYPNFERKDVWDVRWANDDPTLLATMEKTRMCIFKNLEPEEPVQSCANLCRFQSLTVRALQLDEWMLDPERPRKDYVVDFETATLRGTREVLQTLGIKDAYLYVEKTPHPKLWSLLAEHALTALDFTYAELAFVHAKDYPSIQFVKRIRSLDDVKKQSAEIDAYYHRFDESERIYRDMDRKDLALDLRHRMGDWFGVVRLVQEGGGDESLMVQAWENIGDHYADHQKWSKAIQYYMQCKNFRKLAHAYYIIEDFEMLSQLVLMAEHDKDLLLMLGRMLLTVGLAEEASRAFIAAGEVRLAVEGCVEVNAWDRAIVLAEEHRLEDIGQLLRKYATYLIKRDRLPEAIELYRKAGLHTESAKLLAQLGQRASSTSALKAMKFYVLSALEVEKHRKKRSALRKDGTEAVDELLSADHAGVSERSIDAAWRGAEAFHFFLMCQKQILDKNLPAALALAMRLIDYDDLIAPFDSYSLIALSAYLARNFGICSKAFARLEAAERNDETGSHGGQLQLVNFSMDLDVTQRTLASTTVGGPTGGSSALDGTTTSFQLTNPAKGVATATTFTYPTVNLKEPARRFADLAVLIFTRNAPVDTSVDTVKCPSCKSFNKEWASFCIKCKEAFDVCIVSGHSITSEMDAWQCTVCHHKALDTEVDRFKNCPLCHTPRRQRMWTAM